MSSIINLFSEQIFRIWVNTQLCGLVTNRIMIVQRQNKTILMLVSRHHEIWLWNGGGKEKEGGGQEGLNIRG